MDSSAKDRNTKNEDAHVEEIPGEKAPTSRSSSPSKPSAPDPSPSPDPSDPSTPSNPSDPSDPSTPSNPSDPSDPSTPSAPSILREILLTVGGVTLILSVLYHVGPSIPWLGDNLGGIAAVLFVYGAAWRIWRNDKELQDYGISPHPVTKNLLWGVGSVVVVLGLFLAVFIAYYSQVCGEGAGVAGGAGGHALLGPLGRDCRRFTYEALESGVALPPGFWELLLAEVLVVALPEEIFFRGYVQGRLNELWRGRVRILGVELGWAWVAQAALFGLGHFLVDFNPLRLAVAVPALAFGLLREINGSITAAVVFHAACNIFMTVVDHNFFPPLS